MLRRGTKAGTEAVASYGEPVTAQSPARGSPALLAICATLSGLFALAMLHRWEVSPLGLKSYGRVWFYYVSYTDFGFTRRCLLGTRRFRGLRRLLFGRWRWRGLRFGW